MIGRYLTGIRPVVQLVKAEQGQVQVSIFNNSGVNLYMGDDNVSANINQGVPILANTNITFIYEGDLWIGADVDNTQFRAIVSKTLTFDTSKDVNRTSVQVTRQGFLAPKFGGM